MYQAKIRLKRKLILSSFQICITLYVFKKYKTQIFNFNNKLIIADGTYSNTNIKHNSEVETSMNLIFYDPVNCLNLDINFTGGDKKNNEKIKLEEYILERCAFKMRTALNGVFHQ
mgnify:CR=1 FL=1